MSTTFEKADVGGGEITVMIEEPEGPGPHPAPVYCIHLRACSGLDKDAFTLDVARR